MILHRYVVSRVIWAYMLSIGVTYSITLCLFPGLESEIRNTILGEWLPILIMATFNMSDFVGKVRRASHVRSESSVWCVSVFFRGRVFRLAVCSAEIKSGFIKSE